ncbi:hypothetical protein U1E44_13975 [Arenibacter sp. GZD96]|uniref:hypothetical protein n=1 Tax=Aurantibrevibacter litoralis TaxID=3106030 RepID=UPI002B002A37|nr:hypothetical protein [Arenibacter sp. GZD-96]MEA1787205.1 hypothetical protein [Arenibacter sp. GZD-96]
MKKIITTAIACLALMAFSKTTLQSQKATSTATLMHTSQVMDTSGAKKFWDTLKRHCGKAYEGNLNSGAVGDDFKGKQLVIHLLSCNDDEILIPFNVGDNRSRTWILIYKDGRIQLKHDHRHEDGTSDKVTMYGGTTSNSGLPGLAVFPADEETVGVIPAAATNVWWITVNDTAYTYNLRRIGTDRLFSVSFDLTKEIETPKASWGWENYPSSR